MDKDKGMTRRQAVAALLALLFGAALPATAEARGEYPDVKRLRVILDSHDMLNWSGTIRAKVGKTQVNLPVHRLMPLGDQERIRTILYHLRGILQDEYGR